MMCHSMLFLSFPAVFLSYEIMMMCHSMLFLSCRAVFLSDEIMMVCHSMMFLSCLAVFLSYEIMMQCWSEDPDERPTFDELNSIFMECMSQEVSWLLIFPSTNCNESSPAGRGCGSEAAMKHEPSTQ